MVEKTLWFTGLSGSGKSTISKELAKRLIEKGEKVVVLDGNIVRDTLSSDLGFSIEDRDKHITRIANVCYLIGRNNVLNIAAIISPTKKIRDFARKLIGDENFIEVYVKCSIETCMKRDVWGHYAKIKNEKMKNFVGIDLPYDVPENPKIILDTEKMDLNQCVNTILSYIKL